MGLMSLRKKKEQAQAAKRIEFTEEDPSEEEEEIQDEDIEEIQDAIEEEEMPVKKPMKAPQAPIDKWSVQQVATQTESVIYNAKTKKAYTLHEAVVEILNKID